MAEPLTHINYSFEDIQRYLQGKMSATEMHTIEKAALQDPFLADAIEGFNEADLTTARQHLNDINTSLLKERSSLKVIAFNKKTEWLNIAALIIVLAGVSVVASYFFKSSNNQSQIAQVKNKPVANYKTLQDSVTNNINTVPTKTDTSLFIAENKSVKKEKQSIQRNVVANKSALTSKFTEADKDATTSVTAAPIQLTKNNATAMIDTNSYKTADSNADITLQGKVSGISILRSTFSGKVVDKNNKPVGGALIQSADKKDAVITDLNGNFSLQKKDTILNVTASTVGYDVKSARLQEGNNSPIILKGTSSSLDEVVVVGYGIKKHHKAAMPVGGWEHFNNYVVAQLNADSTNRKAFYNNNNDFVELEFLIDEVGTPYNIHVVKPLDDKKNTQAINILKTGPKWTRSSKNKKAKVAISINKQ